VRNGGKNTNIFIGIIIVLMISFGSGCKSNQKVSSQVRDAEKAEEQMRKEEEKEYARARKQHYKMQSKQSKQIMKDGKMMSNAANKAQQRSFWDRLFNKDCK
jgi:3-hydroxy-3-methylglutaryl CoA synthase